MISNWVDIPVVEKRKVLYTQLHRRRGRKSSKAKRLYGLRMIWWPAFYEVSQGCCLLYAFHVSQTAFSYFFSSTSTPTPLFFLRCGNHFVPLLFLFGDQAGNTHPCLQPYTYVLSSPVFSNQWLLLHTHHAYNCSFLNFPNFFAVCLGKNQYRSGQEKDICISCIKNYTLLLCTKY